jgi:hypothetical protein
MIATGDSDVVVLVATGFGIPTFGSVDRNMRSSANFGASSQKLLVGN